MSKLINQEWITYAYKCVPDELRPEVRVHFQQAFFAGAFVAMQHIKHAAMAAADDEGAMRSCYAIEQEITATCDMLAGRHKRK